MRGISGWGLFALLAAIIALSYPPREHTQKEVVYDQVVLEASTMPAGVSRCIHFQKDCRHATAETVPLLQANNSIAFSLDDLATWKGDIAHAACLPVCFPATRSHIATPMPTAIESRKAVTGLKPARNRVLLTYKGAGGAPTRGIA